MSRNRWKNGITSCQEELDMSYKLAALANVAGIALTVVLIANYAMTV